MGSYRPRHQAPSAASAFPRRRGLPAGVIAVACTLALVLAAFLVRPACAAEPADPDADVSVSLGYGDGQDHPGGVTVEPGKSFSGYINVNATSKPTKTITDLKVTLRVPKSHVTGISVTDFNDSWSNTTSSHTISTTTPDGDDYIVTITWPTYDPTATSNIKFSITTESQKTPDGFVFRPVATITSKQNPTAVTSDPLTVTAAYPALALTKSANGKSTDGTPVVGTTATASDGTQYIPEDSAALVSYTFAASGSDRALTSVTVTDTLPTYTDYKGGTRTALFTEAANPGWTKSSDGTTTTVSYTVTSPSSDSASTLVSKVPALKLGFPGLSLSTTGSFTQNGTTTGYNYADVANTAKVTTVVSNPGTNETAPSATDSLSVRVSTGEVASSDSSGFLSVFASGAGGDYEHADIADNLENKNKTLEWHLKATNTRSYDMKNVELDDTSAPSGLTGYGPDKRLKVIDISSMTISGLTNTEVLSAVSAIRAYKDDGGYKDYTLTQSSDGKLSVRFDADTTYAGFSVIFTSGWLWKRSVQIDVYADTKLRDPENVHWTSPQSAAGNNITNMARMSGQTVTETISEDGTTGESVLGTVYSTSSARYILQQFTEKMSITSLGFIGDTNSGSTPVAVETIKGSLDPGKEYKNLRVILVLPKGMTWQGYDHTQAAYGAPQDLCDKLVETSRITTVDNWQGTGRTAVILPLDQSFAKQLMTGSNNWEAWLEFKPKITSDSSPEKDGNVLVSFLTADNAPDPGAQSGFDSYTSELPEVSGAGVYPDHYSVGPFSTIAAAAKAYTVDMGAQLHGSQTIQSASASSKQGIAITKGTPFTYHLTVNNIGDLKRPGLTIYDALPSTTSGSQYDARLTAWPTAPSGYRLLYTTADVSSMSAEEACDNASLWQTQTELTAPGTGKTYSDVTAVKMVPIDSSTTVAANSSLTLSLPVTVPSDATAQDPPASAYSDNPVGSVGLIATLDAINAFWFRTEAGSSSSAGWKKANSTYARLGAIAGFVVKKVDATGSAISTGAEFSLTGGTGTDSTGTTGTDGTAAFYGLRPAEAADTLSRALSETKAPKGYLPADDLRITVTKTSDTLKMACATKSGSACSGSGTVSDPFVVTDMTADPALPMTGGTRRVLLLAGLAGGLLLLSLVVVGVYARRRRKD